MKNNIISSIYIFFFIFFNFFLSSCIKEAIPPNPKKVIEKTKDTINYGEIMDLKKIILSFQAQEGRYPNSLNELLEKGYIKKIPQDQFGGEVSYSVSPDGESFTLTSAGQDKIPETGDDIRY